MGSFHSSLLLRHGGAVPVLRAFGVRATVVTLGGGFHGVVDQHSDTTGDPEVLGSLAATLSHHLRTGVVSALNHDEDLLLMGLFANGELCAEWGWRQWFTRWRIPAGSADAFVSEVCSALGCTAGVEPPSTVFQRLFASTWHRRMSARCGLPDALVGLGYRHVQDGALPEPLNASRVDLS